MTRRNYLHARRDGVTLIELLVVATIMLTLAAVSVPAIKPMMESQATSRAAQTVSTYLERAKARAMTTGRACGVTFEYFDGTYNGDVGSASLVLRQVEEPPTFSGYSFGSYVNVYPDPSYPYFVADSKSPYYGRRVNRVDPSNIAEWNSYGIGDKGDAFIRFNSIGGYFPLVKVGGTYYIVKQHGSELPVYPVTTTGSYDTGASYQVLASYNMPKATMTAPIGLSQGTVVDLEFSGTDSNFFTLGQNVTVMFSPNGEVDYVVDGGERKIPSDTLYFLVGRWDRISALGISDDGNETLADDGLWNFEDGNNCWVTINPQTGVISTAEVNQPFNYTLGDFTDGVWESREFARVSKRNFGGR